MTYKTALAIAKSKCRKDEIEHLDTKSQRRKFALGFGRVRMYAGLPHSRVAK